jgi:hypothetical protein
MNIAWVPCSELGCEAGLQVDVRHWDNITARGWLCDEHDVDGEEAR